MVDNDRRCHARKTPSFFSFSSTLLSVDPPAPHVPGEEPTTIRSIFKVFELAWLRVPDKRLSPEPFHVILEKSSVVAGVERCIEEPRGVPPSSSWTKRHPPNSGPVSHNIHDGQVSFQNTAGGFHLLQVQVKRHPRIIQSLVQFVISLVE